MPLISRPRNAIGWALLAILAALYTFSLLRWWIYSTTEFVPTFIK